MASRIQDSGAAKRKKKQEKEDAIKRNVAKMPKLNTFFSTQVDKVVHIAHSNQDPQEGNNLTMHTAIQIPSSSPSSRNVTPLGDNSENMTLIQPSNMCGTSDTHLEDVVSTPKNVIPFGDGIPDSVHITLSPPQNPHPVNLVSTSPKILDISGDGDILPIIHLPSPCGTTCIEPSNQSPPATLPETDPGLWAILTNEEVSYWIISGPKKCQNRSGPFAASRREFPNQIRFCTERLFNGLKKNGESYERDWLLYSPAKGNVYCFCCKLLSPSTSKFSVDGFSDWRNPKHIKTHETSEEHRKATLALVTRAKVEGCVDIQLEKHIQYERKYWRSVLLRIVEVIKFLTERGLALRGSDELIGSHQNGNFLGTLELLAKFDPFLEEHIARFGNKGKGIPSYLSSTVCDEIIILMGKEILSTICKEVISAKYFSISVDSSPDRSHIDQLTFVVRYVNEDGDSLERFLKFLPISCHGSEYLTECVLKVLAELGFDIQNCRGQSYDNAANMAGHYSGLQARLKEHNPLVDYVPCAAHSLNLIGTASVDCCLEGTKFFRLLQQMYSFSAGSTRRWHLLTADMGRNENGRLLTLKSLSSTRWHCQVEPVKALTLNYAKFYEAFLSLAESTDESADTRLTARGIAEQLLRLETAIMCELWNRILHRFQINSTQLQNTQLDLNAATALLSSLDGFICELNSQFEEIENLARKKMPTIRQQYDTEVTRIRKQKQFHDESQTAATNLTGAPHFRAHTFIVIMDQLRSSLQQRQSAYAQLSLDFAFLQAIKENDMPKMRQSARCVIKKYWNDLDQDSEDEFVQFLEFIKHIECERNPRALLKYMRKEKFVETAFPNVAIALRIFLTLPVTVCEGERSFSKMNLVKNAFRSTMQQERLNSLAILSIEHELTHKLSFDSVVDVFSHAKSRKASL